MRIIDWSSDVCSSDLINKHAKDKCSKASPARRSVLKAGLGAAGAAVLPGFPAVAAATGKPPIGNYPKGVEGDSVFVGLTLDLTGPYSAEGADEQKGYELAIEQLNNGAEQIRKISPLTKKGVLGKTIKYEVANSATKHNMAVQAAMQFMHNNNAKTISGRVSSGVALTRKHLV